MKHIKFQESEVMRGLEQLALKEGWFPEEPIVKEAEMQVRASSNWEENIITLATHLRTRGFVKEADGLEDKYFTWKKLATLTEEAHPEGDVAVAKANGDLADVETTESRHSKMVEVLKKQPTGKQASLDSWIVNVADELGVSLSKLGQDAPADAGLQPAPTTPVEKEEKKNYYFSDRQALINKNLTAVNEFVVAGLKPVSDKITDISNSISVKLFTFTPLAIEQSIKAGGAGQYQLYVQMSGTKPSAIGAFILAYNSVYGGNLDPKEQVTYAMGKLTQSDPAAVKGYLDNISPGLYEQYYSDKGLSQAGGLGFGGALENVAKKAYSATVAVIKSKDTAAWGGLDKANAALQGIVNNALTSFATVQKNIENFVYLIPNKDESNAPVIDQLVKMQLSLNSIKIDPKIVETFEAAKLLNVKEISGVIGGVVQGVKTMPITANDVYPAEKEVLDIAGKFYQMGKSLNAYLSTLDPNSVEAKKEAPFMDKLMSIHKTITEFKDRPIAELIAQISNIIPGVKSYADLQRLAGLWGDYYSKLASQNEQLIKLAVPPGLDVPAPVPGKAVAPKANKPSPTSEMVKKMQQTLLELADAFKKAGGTSSEDLAALMGSKADGIWGALTQKSLAVANKLLQASLSLTPVSVDSASANTAILEKAIQNGQTGETSQVYDALPKQKIEWTVTPPDFADQPSNPVKIKASDLGNLTTFVNFLFANGLETPTLTGRTDIKIGQEGIPMLTLLNSLKWFAARSKIKYDRYKVDPGLASSKQLAMDYNQSINQLYQAWSQIFKAQLAQGKSEDQVNATVMPASGLAMASGVGIEEGGGSASEMAPGQRAGKGYGDLDGRSGMGGRNSQNSAPPIGEFIDLKNPLWGAGGQYNMLVRLTDVENQPAQYLAKLYFGDANGMSADQAQMQALQLMGFNDENSLRDRVDQLNRSNPSQAQSLQNQYQQAYNRGLTQGPMEALRSFLTFLNQHISPVIRNWMNNTRPAPIQEEVENTLNYGQRWVAAIGRRLSEIGSWTGGR